MEKSNFTRTLASIALVGSLATTGCSNRNEDPATVEDYAKLADAKKRLNEAELSLDKAKFERAKADRRLDNLYKETTPEAAALKLQEAHAQVIRSQTADAIEQALAKDDLDRAIHICQMSREGYKERHGSYPIPDLNCQ